MNILATDGLHDDPNRLPLEMMPEGWCVRDLGMRHNPAGDWWCSVRIIDDKKYDYDRCGYGQNPRAATLDAIARITRP